MEYQKRNSKMKRKIYKFIFIFISIYSFLFLIIGPKFSLWRVSKDASEGMFIRNRIESFVGGLHQNSIIELCFEGILKGVQGQMSLLITEEQLALKEEDSLGTIRLLSRDISNNCQDFEESNIVFEILPRGSNQKRILLSDNKEFLNLLPNASYLFFFSTSYTGELRDSLFSIYWIDEQGEIEFYNFGLRGGLHENINVSRLDIFIAFLEDYLKWPYRLFLLLSRAGSH